MAPVWDVQSGLGHVEGRAAGGAHTWQAGQMWQAVIGVVVGVLVVYAVLLVALWVWARRHPDAVTLKDALRLVPDLVRLIRRLAADRSITRGVRVRLALLLVYLASPIDLVPDFVPVVGYADDAVIVAVVLRSVVRSAGVEALGRHWPGSPAGLAVVEQLAGVRRATGTPPSLP